MSSSSSSTASGSGNGKRKAARRTYACLCCRDRRVKCDGCLPCGSCVRGRRRCRYDQEQTINRSDSHAHAREHQETLPDNKGCSFNSPQPLTQRPVINNAQHLRPDQMRFIRIYHKLVHTYAPIVCTSMLKEGLNPIMLESVDLVSTQSDAAKLHAAKSATWAAAVIGACFESNCDAVEMYSQAIEHLRGCYDYPCEEVVRAYCAVAFAASHLGDEDRWRRFKAAAEILLHEVPVISDECRVCLFRVSGVWQSDRLETDLDILGRIPFHLQVLYVLSLGSKNSGEMSSLTPSDKLMLHCEHVLSFLRPMCARLTESYDCYPNVLGRFYCFSLASYYAVHLGEIEEALRYTQEILSLLSASPNQILVVEEAWNITKTIAGFLHVFGYSDRAAIVQTYLTEYRCFYPLGIAPIKLRRDKVLSFLQFMEKVSVARRESSIEDLQGADDEKGVCQQSSEESSTGDYTRPNEAQPEDELIDILAFFFDD